MTATSDCYDRGTLLAWALGRMPRDRFEAVSAHLDHCAACQSAVGAFDEVCDPLVRLLGDPGPAVPSTLAPRSQGSTIDHKPAGDTVGPGCKPAPPSLNGLAELDVRELIGEG